MGAVFGLIIIVVILAFFAFIIWIDERPEHPRPSSKEQGALRHAERVLYEIENNTTDIYAAGKASAAAEKIRKVLDREDPIR